ncbi:MAG: hypothetical protein KGP27_19180 [Hyphomicrobiales bacterium]|nr:hypothetical protein [Hyphomicrobiales bacterium]
MRYVIAAAMAIAVGFTVTAAVSPAEAQSKGKSKMCMATTNAGKKVSFRCAANEKCCWQVVTQKASCLPSTAICL